MAEIPFGEYAPDKQSLGGKTTSYVNNVLPSINGYAPARGVSQLTDALPAQCRGMAGVVQSDGTSGLFSGTSTKLYKVSNTGAFSDVTRTSGGDYSVASDNMWDFCQFGDRVIAVTHSNAPQSFVLGSSTNFAALSGSPPQAKRCAVVGNFVVLAALSTSGNSNRIEWSAFDDPTGWTVGTDQCDYQDFPDGGEVMGIIGGEVGLVIQERAIRRMVYVGPPEIFEFQKISDNKGALLRYSICKAGDYGFFYGGDGFYRIDIAGNIAPIGANRVNATVAAELDGDTHINMCGAPDPYSTRVWWFYQTTSATDRLDKAVVYDWFLDRWSPVTIETQWAAPIVPLVISGVGFYYKFQIAAMDSAKKVGFLNGTTLEAKMDIPEGTVGNGMRAFARGIQPITDADNAYLSVRYRDRLIDSLSISSETQIGSNGYAPVRVNARYLTPRVRIAAGESWTYARGVEVDTRSGGRR